MKYKYSQSGFSIVELMIAIFIGLIVLTGLVTVFETTATLNRTQNGLARLQENGRFITLQMKNALDQAGYQYCLSSTGGERSSVAFDALAGQYGNFVSKIEPWRVLGGQEVFPGVPVGPLFDPRHFIHGHECGESTCLPDFTSAGTDTSYLIPGIGVGDGDRIAGTDVLTVRYISGRGRAVSLINDRVELATTQTLVYDTREDLGSTIQFPSNNTPILIASCSLEQQHVVTTLIAGDANVATFASPEIEPVNGVRPLVRVFDLTKDIRNITYYVANNIVNGRDVPTLYSVDNGTVNALIEGVDRFDVLYTIQTAIKGGYLVLDAQGVDELPVDSCTTDSADLLNTPGCGWRSVVSIEFHLLLNTVQNSSNSENEAFFYSIDGDQAQTAADLPSPINHYNLHRREFYSVVATKNWN